MQYFTSRFVSLWPVNTSDAYMQSSLIAPSHMLEHPVLCLTYTRDLILSPHCMSEDFDKVFFF